MTPLALSIVILVALLVVPHAATLHDDGVLGVPPGLSPPLCERPDCTCTEDNGDREGRGLRVSCDFDPRRPTSIASTATQVVLLDRSSLPLRLRHLTLAGGGQVEVRLLPTSFSHLQLLQRASFSRLHRLHVKRHAFTNASHDGPDAKGLLLEIEDCNAVLLETNAFLDVRAPLTALVARTGHVVVQGSALFWLRALSLVDVARLELHEHALALRDVHERAGPLASVLMQNTVLAEIPQHAFPSSLSDVLIVGSEIRAIRRDAFSALQIRAVRLLETSVHRLDGGAFSARTLILSLELRGARLHQVSSGAVSSAVNNLTIANSKLYEVLGGAFNLTVAAVALRHSVLDRVRSQGFALNNWNSMELHNNTLGWLEPFAFHAPFRPVPGVDAYHFRFTDNVIGNTLARAFAFAAADGDRGDDDEETVDDEDGVGVPYLPAEVSGNVFERSCHCEMRALLVEIVSPPAPWRPWLPADLLFNTSACLVDKRQAKCFGLTEGRTALANYSALICDSDDIAGAPCEADEDVNDIVEPKPPVLEGHGRHGDTVLGHEDTALNFEAGLQREKKVLAGIFVVVVASLALVLAVSGAAWLARKGGGSRCSYTALCSRLRTMSEASAGGGGLVSASSARSISRLSVHEYERQHSSLHSSHATGTGVTTLTLHPDEDDDADWVPCEDKATQTLPEELTQELLQTLREKLDDPDNYSEARDMIEHLYDLIKVEESCNSNHRSLSDLRLHELEELDGYIDDEEEAGEHVYDVIRPQQRPPSRPRVPRGLQANRCTVTVGTRAPSPDKLAEGRLGPGGSPNQPYNETRLRPANAPNGLNGVAKPAANMLRSIGQSLASLHSVAAVPAGPHRPAPAIPAPNPAVLCDYAEPTDAKVHVYCELPPTAPSGEPPTAPCSPVVCRMANRPLPSKPNLQ